MASQPRLIPRDTQTGLVTCGGSSLVGSSTGFKKLNGQVYTPLPVAEHMLRLIKWPTRDPDERLLDPACGDGVFLEAAVRKVLNLDTGNSSKKEIIETRLIGWDLDPAAIAAAKERLSPLLRRGLGNKNPSLCLELRNALVSMPDERFACVVGNPPYLEAKRMPKSLKQLIRHSCPLAGRGAFDLYTAFLERAFELTSEADGEICFLIPNRFLVASYAEPLRREMLSRLDVRVLDLSREDVFHDAAVYPIIVHAAPASLSPSYRVLPRTGAGPGVDVDAKILLGRSSTMPLAPTHADGQKLLSRVFRERRFRPMESLGKARWTVSFHKAGLRDQYVFDTRPSRGHQVRQFLGGGRFAGNREVEPYTIRWKGSWIDYDEQRAKSDGNPLPPVELFTRPKLVVCQNSRRARAAVDREGYVLKDTFIAVVPANEDDALLEWLCMVVNSDVMHYLYEHMFAGTRKNGGYLHFIPRYLTHLPIPPAPAPSWIRDTHAALAAGEDRWSEVEEEVRRAYGISRKEARALELYPFPKH